MNDKLFWIDYFEGKFKGGYFIRNNLSKFLKRIEAKGLKPVGIRVDDSWNLEVFVEEEDSHE